MRIEVRIPNSLLFRCPDLTFNSTNTVRTPCRLSRCAFLCDRSNTVSRSVRRTQKKHRWRSFKSLSDESWSFEFEHRPHLSYNHLCLVLSAGFRSEWRWKTTPLQSAADGICWKMSTILSETAAEKHPSNIIFPDVGQMKDLIANVCWPQPSGHVWAIVSMCVFRCV